MTPRWAFLAAWVRSVYLGEGPGTGAIALDQADRTKASERFPILLGLWQELRRDPASDYFAGEWARRQNQLSRWLGCEEDALCELVLQAAEVAQ